MQVPLDDIMLIWVKILQVASQKYATTLRGCFRLGDKCLTVLLPTLLCLITELLPEFSVLGGQEPGLREELVILGI